MAYGNKRKTKRRYPRRRRRYNRSIVTRAPIARTLFTKLKYSEDIQLNPSTGDYASNYYNPMGLYDPNVSVGGHQPYGFDQLMTLYKKYTVHGCKMTVTFQSTSSVIATGFAVCGIRNVNAGGAVTLDIESIRETQGCVYGYLGNTDSSKALLRLSKTFSPKKFFGVKSLSAENYKGDETANPTPDLAYQQVWVAAPTAAEDPAIVVCHVSIEYMVQFSIPREFIPS